MNPRTLIQSNQLTNTYTLPINNSIYQVASQHSKRIMQTCTGDTIVVRISVPLQCSIFTRPHRSMNLFGQTFHKVSSNVQVKQESEVITRQKRGSRYFSCKMFGTEWPGTPVDASNGKPPPTMYSISNKMN